MALILACSCKKVINVDIHNSAPQIVIVGEVTNGPGPYQVTITQTVNFNDSNNFPPVSGASVLITNENGLRDSLTESSPGLYLTHSNWQGSPGLLYTLSVTAGGNTYTAQSTMPQPVPLDSVGFFFDNNRGGGNTIIEAIPYFQDPAGIHNYYRFTETVNGIPLNKVFIFNDQFSDGRYIHEPLYDDSSYSHLQPKDSLDLSMYCIDSATYGYLNTLLQVSSTGFQSATPANPNANFSGGALGYFSAHTTETKSAIVP
jgi:hypothetical protein